MSPGRPHVPQSSRGRGGGTSGSGHGEAAPSLWSLDLSQDQDRCEVPSGLLAPGTEAGSCCLFPVESKLICVYFALNSVFASSVLPDLGLFFPPSQLN